MCDINQMVKSADDALNGVSKHSNDSIKEAVREARKLADGMLIGMPLPTIILKELAKRIVVEIQKELR